MSEVAANTVVPAAAPLRILLVEDDEFDVAVFGRAFHRSGIACEIVRCRTGEEAIAGLRDAELELDLLVTDHQLPGVPGFDLCLRLIESFAKAPPFALVLLTGVGSEQMAIKALRVGIDDYIVKDSSSEYLELLPLVLPKVARRHRWRRRRRLAARRARAGDQTPAETETARLGLAACAGVVRDRGGRIWVENGAGEAPTLHFSVPLAPSEVAFWTAGGEAAAMESATAGTAVAGPADDGDRPAEPGKDPPAPKGESAGEPRHVLIAHPNPIVTFVAQRTVERAGCRCTAVENGDKALEALDREPFDLVLMGLEMRGLDGLEATRRLRRRGGWPDGKVTVLALGAPAGDADRCAEAGMDGTILVPVSARGVQAAIAGLGQI